MKKVGTLLLVMMTFMPLLRAQEYFRSGMFLHHSTGAYIWGPNPDGTSGTTIPNEMDNFNLFYDLTGNNAVSMEEEWWAPSDNEWATQHEFFEWNTSFTDIQYYLDNYKILVVKSCFPSSEIDSWGQESDTIDPTYKTVMNYKWHWRHILTVMQSHPDHFFVIWTNAPLEVTSTNSAQAMLAKKFCTWAKDTLAAGLDPVFGTFPPNVYVFDYFNKTAGSDGMELPQYVTGPGDSHPNGAATDHIAPQFVNEIFWAAIEYESIFNGLPEHPFEKQVLCYPNPFNESLKFKAVLPCEGMVNISLINEMGCMVRQISFPGSGGFWENEIDGKDLKPGLYGYRVIAGEKVFHGTVIKY